LFFTFTGDLKNRSAKERVEGITALRKLGVGAGVPSRAKEKKKVWTKCAKGQERGQVDPTFSGGEGGDVSMRREVKRQCEEGGPSCGRAARGTKEKKKFYPPYENKIKGERQSLKGGGQLTTQTG